MKLKNIGLAILSAIIVTIIIIIIFGSGVLSTTMGVIYLILILVCLGILAFLGLKLLREKKIEEKINEIINDPEKLIGKLSQDNRVFVSDGKRVEFSLKENKKTGKKEVEIKLGSPVLQEWRKKYETTPIEKEQEEQKASKDKSKKPAKDAKKPKAPKDPGSQKRVPKAPKGKV